MIAINDFLMYCHSESLDLFALEYGNKTRKLTVNTSMNRPGKMFNVSPDSKALVRSDETIEVPDKHGFFQACMQ